MIASSRLSTPLWYLFTALLVAFFVGAALTAGGAFAGAPGGLPAATGPKVPLDTPTSTPTTLPCGPGSDYIINASTGASIDLGTTLVPGSQCDDCIISVTLPFAFNYYGVPFTSAGLSSNGNIQFVSFDSTFSNVCLPASSLNYAIMPHWDDLDMRTAISATSGVFISTVGSTPNRTFNAEWRACLYNNPNGPCGGEAHFEVKLYETPLLDGTQFDFVYANIANNGSSATVGVQKSNGADYTQYSCNTPDLQSGLRLSFRPLACGEATSTPTNTRSPTITSTPANTFTSTPTPNACGPNSNYTITQSTGTIAPGANLVAGSQCDDCVSGIPLPFSFRLYGQLFSSVSASSNGNLQFGSSDPESSNVCLPDTLLASAIMPHYDDLNMSSSVTSSLGPLGIYTVLSGVAPTRVFNIEYRACLYNGPNACGGNINFEVRLFEGSDSFQVVYGSVANGGADATVGVQQNGGNLFTQYECDTPGSLTPGLQLNFDQAPCGTGTPTAIAVTNTPTNTATNTPMGTATAGFTVLATSTRTHTPVLTVTSTRTNTPNSTLTPTPTSVLVGHVTWQGRPPQPNTLQQVPITLTLKMGATEVNYPPQTTDASGYFTVSVGSLPPGTYGWRVKSLRYLANAGTVALGGSKIEDYRLKIGKSKSSTFNLQSSIQVEMGLMRVGDADNNNVVNVTDFNIVKNAFGKTVGDPGYDARADFNGDNTINVTDFNLLKANFGQSGAGPI